MGIVVTAPAARGQNRSADATRQADAAFRAQNFEQAALMYAEITQREPGNPVAWYRLGYSLHATKRYPEAIAAHQRAASFEAVKINATYNLACAYALTGQTKDALDTLERAIEAGFRNANLLKTDTDFTSIRGNARLAALIHLVEKKNQERRDAFRRFDFWVGDWNVFDASGKQIGVNRVETQLNGFLIRENFSGAAPEPIEGISFNFYDPVNSRWKQVWVDDRGGVSTFEGNWDGSAMRMTGRRATRDGKTESARMSIEPRGDGELHQLIEHSGDDGRTWYVWSDRTYKLSDRVEPPVVAAAPRTPRRKECEQFDFWAGDWDVFTPPGALNGHNQIEKLLGGHLILENWKGTGSGGEGKSLNYFDPGTGTWKQNWVSDNGGLVWYEGGFADGVMSVAGWRQDPSGKKTRVRVRWKPLDETRVSHLIEQSTDGGVTWRTYFDGTYRPRK